MITSAEHIDPDKKRTLKKVRTNFLTKRQDLEECTLSLVPKPLNPYNEYMINGAWGLIEKDRNIFMGIKYLNSCLDVRNVKIQDAWNTKQVVLRPQISNQACLMPWEYSVKRLESYGDLELATFAHRIRDLHCRSHNLIGEYQRLMKSDDIETIEKIEKARLNVRDWRKRTESTYPFTLMKFMYDKSGANLQSIVFNEPILKEIGKSVEGFARWAESNGIPIVFPHVEKVSRVEGKRIVSQSIPIVPKVKEGPEFEDYISNANGEQRKVVIQGVEVIEPTESGVLIYVYTLLKNSQTQSSGLEDKIDEEYHQNELKWVKYESQVGVSMEQGYEKMTE